MLDLVQGVTLPNGVSIDGALLLGIAGVITAVGGIFSAYKAFRKSKQDDAAKCREELKEARADGELYAKKAYDLTMAQYRETLETAHRMDEMKTEEIPLHGDLGLPTAPMPVLSVEHSFKPEDEQW